MRTPEQQVYLEHAGERTRTVLEAVESREDGVTVPRLVDMTGIDRHSLSNSLTRLLRMGLIARPVRGYYRKIG